MLVLDGQDEKVDRLHFLLPHTQRARKPEEVAYLVVLRYHRESAGVYEFRGKDVRNGVQVPAWRWDCDVQIIEAATRRGSATTIRGPDPRDVIRERSTETTEGPRPTLLVREYLMGLASASPR
jgi:hypothetical protein